MKKINLTYFLCLFLTTIISTSCSDKNEEIEKSIEKEDISAKWEINNSTYKSVEFNKDGKYILVKENLTAKKGISNNNEQVILFGDYEISNSNTIELIDFGKIIITDLDQNSMSFKIVSNENPEAEIIVTSEIVKKINDSSNTELLCRTWIMNKVNNEDVKGTEYELTVIFSQAGTYFVELANPVDGNQGGLAEWKWSNETEEKLCYAWDEVLTCTEDNKVSVTVSTEKLIIIEGEDTYELLPYSSNSSAAKSNKSTNNFPFPKGVFNK